jgi:hypothetical protein
VGQITKESRVNWLLLALAVPLWLVQYLLFVPVVILWRVFVAIVRFALMVGLWGLLLLFLPIIGWGILLVLLLSRRDDRRYRELVEAIAAREGIDTRRRSLFRPWLIDQVRGTRRGD